MRQSGIILTVRLNSSRLKNKAIFPLNNLTAIEQIILRLKETKLKKKIVLCTTKNKKDKIFFKFAKKHNINFYSGSSKDVLKRIYDGAKKNKLKNIIACTGDNPLIDFEYIDKLLNFHLKKKNDFSYTNGLPWGTFALAASTNALKKALEIKDTIDTEVWYEYLLIKKFFKSECLYVKRKIYNNKKLRLTMDYKKDYLLFRLIYILLQEKNIPLKNLEVLKFLKKNKYILKINKNCKQKKAKKIKIKKIYLNGK